MQQLLVSFVDSALCRQKGIAFQLGKRSQRKCRQILKTKRKIRKWISLGSGAHAVELICSYAGAVSKGRAVSQEWLAGSWINTWRNGKS